jgi:hypothetical protein
MSVCTFFAKLKASGSSCCRCLTVIKEQDTLLDTLFKIQHDFNPLHLYCRLIERGLGKGLSMSICRYYEALIYSWLVWFTVVAVQICRLARRII